jgi:hypothetical protein
MLRLGNSLANLEINFVLVVSARVNSAWYLIFVERQAPPPRTGHGERFYISRLLTGTRIPAQYPAVMVEATGIRERIWNEQTEVQP